MDKRVLVVAPPEEIDANTVREFMEVLNILDLQKGPIEVRIFSGGGQLNAAIAMYDAMRSAKNEITTVGYGLVGSAAVLLLQAGSKRALAENAILYVHETMAEGGGNLTTMKTHINETERLHKQYCTLISGRAAMQVGTFELMCKTEGFVTPETALKLGLIDEIIKPTARKSVKRKAKK